ncbi:FAD-dependent oxidoreductase [Deinococcus lacus]|uniref:FAD-dependent oxidoreductase n=1 Tax=Deinococcus lacus TaxID=392561 RepID=A0ABW1YEB8_9DEIO
MPPDLKLFVPLSDETFMNSGLLSESGLRRFLEEQHLPPRPADDSDESLAAFVRRRFGEEALDFVVPMMAGIYMADPETLSMRATFPQYLAFEQTDGSVIQGSGALRPRPSSRDGPVRPYLCRFGAV